MDKYKEKAEKKAAKAKGYVKEYGKYAVAAILVVGFFALLITA